MSRELLDYDPLTGRAEYIETDGDTVTIRTEEDIEPLLDHNKRWANEGMTDDGIKDGMWHYANVPMTVLMELYKKGINMFHPGPGDWKRFFVEINTNYPLLRVTNKWHYEK